MANVHLNLGDINQYQRGIEQIRVLCQEDRRRSAAEQNQQQIIVTLQAANDARNANPILLMLNPSNLYVTAINGNALAGAALNYQGMNIPEAFTPASLHEASLVGAHQHFLAIFLVAEEARLT
eukprot:TRINITY_DN37072_c0_g1_i2.p1 TRINITY_DN37072_c0_g1~~TRINITY_DN37072_c0_g1_i2.p1  ORF type:complete len:142 (-),score=21.97 TRINITY_DN37072_c0_g1_i2:70-438(-)